MRARQEAAPRKCAVPLPVAVGARLLGKKFRFGMPSQDFRTFLRCFAVAALCFVLLLSTGIGRQGDTAALLHDTDDVMRLVQVVDWLDGQNWNDTVQRRLNPPEGVDMHWSRLADLPLAGAISLAEPWLGRPAAMHLAALTVPPLLGALLAMAFLWSSASLLPERRAPLQVAMVTALIVPLQYMLAGRVDHHGLQLLLTALAIGCLFRAFQPSDLRPSVGLGIAGGVSLAIGLETLPFLGAAAIILSLAWVWRQGTASTLVCFGAVLTASSLALILLTQPSSAWTAVACDRMSFAHLALNATVFAAGIAALALERLRPRASWPWRFVTVSGVGMAGLALVLAAFPQCAGGPYSGLSDDIGYWLVRVNEAQSLADLFGWKPSVAVSAVILPVVALVTLGWQWMRASDRSDLRLPALGLLVLSGLAVTAWQIRGMGYAGLVAGFALIPLAAAASERARLSRRIWARLGLRVCVPLTCVFAVIAPLKLQPEPGTGGWNAGCNVTAVLAELNDPAGLGAAEQILAAPIDAGPALLFLSRHSVLAGPYHRNVQGLSDNRRVFAGTEAQARATVVARGVDAIIFCRKLANRSDYADRPAFLDERLASDRPPGWLLPVALGEDIALYRVAMDPFAAR